MTRQLIYALAPLLAEGRDDARPVRRRERITVPRWLRHCALVCLYLGAVSVYGALVWALLVNRLSAATRLDGPCGAILLPC